MAKSNKVVPMILTLLVIAGLFAVAGSIIWLGLRSNPTVRGSLASSQSNSQTGDAESPVPMPKSLDQVVVASDRGVDYIQLRTYLQKKDWRNADRETYLRLLDAAGPKAQAIGMTPSEEIGTISCKDLRTVDQLWNRATDGQQGFSVQMEILRALGSDYRKLYSKVGWQELPPSNRWLFEWDYNPQTKRMQFKPGREANYMNPPPGHLPTVEIGYNMDVAFSGALKRCGF